MATTTESGASLMDYEVLLTNVWHNSQPIKQFLIDGSYGVQVSTCSVCQWFGWNHMIPAPFFILMVDQSNINPKIILYYSIAMVEAC
ncbi:hypothetical protein KP509_1Z088100 [Ceratopteris richardii]|nr:hypothetical protein KP509_1Z088100 [Ceratopteris richardii]